MIGTFFLFLINHAGHVPCWQLRLHRATNGASTSCDGVGVKKNQLALDRWSALMEETAMNRTLGFGIAVFFALVGISLLGGDEQAVAGSGCSGVSSCCGPSVCSGGCSGRCFGSRRSRRCSGGCSGCNGCSGYSSCSGDCGGCSGRRSRRCGGGSNCCGTVVSCGGMVYHKGGAAVQKGGAAQKGGAVQTGAEGSVIPPAPSPASASVQAAPRYYRIVFRR